MLISEYGMTECGIKRSWPDLRYNSEIYLEGKAVPQLMLLVAGSPQRGPGFEPGSGHVGFVVDKVALGKRLSEYYGF
jgi:hypothetical protein